MLLVLAWNVLFGGFHGATSLCFGGGHEACGHDHDPGHDHHHDHATCAHESGWPVPTPSDEPHDCCCTDVEVLFVEFLGIVRPDADDRPVGLTAPPALVFADLVAAGNLRRIAPPPLPPPQARDAAAAQRLAIVRTTRLLI